MTPESRDVIRRCLISEIEAFERDLGDRRPDRDFEGNPKRDVREDYLAKLRRALDEVGR